MYTEFTDFALNLIDIIEQQNGEARFVGGCVRDALLTKPFNDIDIATTLPPEQIVSLLQEKGIRTAIHGITHGTVTAIYGKEAVEITTLRRDVVCDGRHAQVAFTDDWRLDASRRDFTMNAIFIDKAGKVHDYFDGVQDAQEGRVRFIGDAQSRIGEDYLRILRLFRFHALYGKVPIDEVALEACAENASHLLSLATERVSYEFLRMLSAPMPIYALKMMKRCGVLGHVLPIDYCGIDELHHLLEVEQEVNPLLKLSILLCRLSDIEDGVHKLADYWHLSNNQRNYMLSILNPELAVSFSMSEQEQQRAIRVLGKEKYRDSLLLLFAKEDRSSVSRLKELMRYADHWVVPKLPVKGVDLLKLGIKEGQEIGRILKEAEEYWESKHYNATQEQILQHLNIQTLTSELS